MKRTALDLAAFEAFATEFSRQLRGGDVVALQGELGSGKTTFVAAIVRALHGRDSVASPTFTFWHRYAGAPPLEHLDLYRIEDRAEARELGLHEALETGGITLIEWPERLPEIVPARAIWVRIVGAGDEPRDVCVERATP